MAIRRIDQTYTPEAPSGGLIQAAIANPFEGLMKTVEDFATQQGKQNAQQAALTDVMAGKQPGPSIGMTPFGQAYNDAAQKAYEAQTSNDLRAKSIEIASQFSGMKAGDADNADQMMKAHIEGLSKNIPEQFRASVLFEAEARRADLYSKIAGAEKEHQFKMNIEDIKSALDNDLIEAQMRARDGDIEKANLIAAKAQERAQSLVGYGVLTPDMAASSMREFKDAQGAEEVIGSAIRSGNIMQTVKAVQDGAGRFAETPLKTRDYIIRELTQELSKQDTLSKKQAITYEKILKDGIEGIKNGERPTQEWLNIINMATNGDIVVTPRTLKKSIAFKETADVESEIAKMDSGKAAEFRSQWESRVPANRTESFMKERIQGAFAARDSEINRDPIRYFQKRWQDRFPTVAFDQDILRDPVKTGAILRELDTQRKLIQEQVGINAPPLNLEDQQKFVDAYTTMNPDEKAQLRAVIQGSMSRDSATKMYEIMAKNDAPASSQAGVLSLSGFPQISRTVDEGIAAMKAGLKMTMPMPFEIDAAMASYNKVMSGGTEGSPSEATIAQIGAIKDAAQAYATAVALKEGKSLVTTDEFKKALKKVGGEIVDHGGYFFGLLGSNKIMLPYGIDNSTRYEGLKGIDYFNNVWNSVTPEAAKDLGWPDPEGITDAIKSGDYQLESVGNGLYIMKVGNAYVLNENGKAFKFNWFNARDVLNAKYRSGTQQ